MDYAELTIKPSKQMLNALARDKMSLYPFSLTYLQSRSPEDCNIYCQVFMHSPSQSPHF